MNITTCYISEYFIYKAVASEEEVRICRARVGASRTLGLAVMKIKVNVFFLTMLSFHIYINGPISSQSKEGLYVKRN